MTSSAFTQTWRTSYFFHTTAGVDTFFDVYAEQQRAMLHPDYSDAEIRLEAEDLPDALGGHLELGGQVMQRRAVLFAQPAGFDDAPAAGIEAVQRVLQSGRPAFLAFLGLQNAQRLGVLVGSEVIHGRVGVLVVVVEAAVITALWFLGRYFG